MKPDVAGTALDESWVPLPTLTMPLMPMMPSVSALQSQGVKSWADECEPPEAKPRSSRASNRKTQLPTTPSTPRASRDSSIASRNSSVASLRKRAPWLDDGMPSCQKAPVRTRGRGRRKTREDNAKPYANGSKDEATVIDTSKGDAKAATKTWIGEPLPSLPLTRSAASELALVLDGVL